MANNYTQGTVSPRVIPLTDEMKAVIDWSEDESVLNKDGNRQDDVEDDAWFEKQAPVDRIAIELGLYGDDEYRSGQLSYKERGDGSYLYCEYGANDSTVRVLQWILKQLPEEITHLSLEGAFTCSKLMPGEFGGFACFITRDWVQWSGTQSWLRGMENLLKTVKMEGSPKAWDLQPEYDHPDDPRTFAREWFAANGPMSPLGLSADAVIIATLLCELEKARSACRTTLLALVPPEGRDFDLSDLNAPREACIKAVGLPVYAETDDGSDDHYRFER